MGSGSSRPMHENNSPSSTNARQTPKRSPSHKRTHQTMPSRTPAKTPSKTSPSPNTRTSPKTTSRTPSRTPSRSPPRTPPSTSATTPHRTLPRTYHARRLANEYDSPKKSPRSESCKNRTPKTRTCPRPVARSPKCNISCENSENDMSELRQELEHIKHDLKKQKKYRAALQLATIGSDCSVDTVYSDESVVDVHFYCKKRDKSNTCCNGQMSDTSDDTSSETDDDTCDNSYTSDSTDTECGYDTADSYYSDESEDRSNTCVTAFEDYSSDTDIIDDECSFVCDTIEPYSCDIEKKKKSRVSPFASPSAHSRFRSIKTILKKKPVCSTPVKKPCTPRCAPKSPPRCNVSPIKTPCKSFRHSETQTPMRDRCKPRRTPKSAKRCVKMSQSLSSFSSSGTSSVDSVCNNTCPPSMKYQDKCHKEKVRCDYTPACEKKPICSEPPKTCADACTQVEDERECEVKRDVQKVQCPYSPPRQEPVICNANMEPVETHNEFEGTCDEQIVQCPYIPPSEEEQICSEVEPEISYSDVAVAINKTCPLTMNGLDLQEFDSDSQHLNAKSSFCFHCLNAYEAVIKKFLTSELQKLTSNHNKKNVILTTTLQKNGLYHINISLKPNGDYLGCLYANKQAIMEASREEEFKRYLNVFVASDPKMIDEHQFINFDIKFASYKT
ncbi:cell wall protein DAN4-like [Teleopsis dalmanni]|uniref:cell wall protein DAN4-like n=1 Tax=Teleopsis dalmanni TaxID=139649 RepID=UPI0018CE39EE|nr:cell wall protein DAN4-like [Teleopsis dalmanni]